MKCNKAIFYGGNFDKWLELIKTNFPHVNKIICRGTGLTSIRCMGMKSIDCSDNKLEYLITDAEHVICNNNFLTRLNLPNATVVKCNNNKLKHLRCTKATYVECNNNQLSNLWLPVALCIRCNDNNLVGIYSPNVILIECENNFLSIKDIYK